MKPSRFAYFSPDNVDAAISAFQSMGADSRYLAGGQSLVPMMNLRVAAPTALIDLNGVSELSQLRIEADGGLLIGAMMRTRQLETDPTIANANPLLAAAAAHVAHIQIRNRGTLGGSIAHADPAAEIPAIAVVCDADILLRGPAGARTVKSTEFFEGVFTTGLDAAELIEAVRFPAWPGERRWAFAEIARREGDYALAGIAAWFDLDAEGRISACAITAIGAGDTPLRLSTAEGMLIGSRPSTSLLEKAAERTDIDIEPFDDLHASAEYRREVSAVLVRRTLTTAWERGL